MEGGNRSDDSYRNCDELMRLESRGERSKPNIFREFVFDQKNALRNLMLRLRLNTGPFLRRCGVM